MCCGWEAGSPQVLSLSISIHRSALVTLLSASQSFKTAFYADAMYAYTCVCVCVFIIFPKCVDSWCLWRFYYYYFLFSRNGLSRPKTRVATAIRPARHVVDPKLIGWSSSTANDEDFWQNEETHTNCTNRIEQKPVYKTTMLLPNTVLKCKCTHTHTQQSVVVLSTVNRERICRSFIWKVQWRAPVL